MADKADELVKAIERFIDAKIRLHTQSDPSRREVKVLDEARSALATAMNQALRVSPADEHET